MDERLRNIFSDISKFEGEHILVIEELLSKVFALSDFNNINDILKKIFNKIVVHTLFSERIGHLAFNTEIFLRRQYEKKEEYAKNKEIHLLVNSTPKESIANNQLLNMIKRVFPVIDSWVLIELINVLSQIDSELWDYKTGIDSVLPGNSNEFHEMNDLPSQLYFTDDEEVIGKRLLGNMGINLDKKYVCFHSRDQQYLKEKINQRDWSYHDYRDCSIENYLPAAEYLAEQGIYALRMGEIVEKPIGSQNERIIDYSMKYRSDFGDIYLPAHCKFFLGNTAGIFLVSTIFGIPAACANYAAFGYAPFLKSDLFIPKKYWYIPEKRFLSFSELVRSRIDKWGNYGQNYDKLGIEVIENTADEIKDLAKEMNDRIDGKWINTQEDEELQTRFKSLIEPYTNCYGFPGRIGSVFLKQNQKLLE